MDPAPGSPQTFNFLFRTDQGSISRIVWLRSATILAGVGTVATLVWRMMRQYTVDPINQPPLLAVAGYVYLLVYTFGSIVILVSLYNLSAKRFFAVGMARSLAAVFPASLLFAGAVAWYVPRSQGALSHWVTVAAVVLSIGVAGWNVYTLGVRTSLQR